MNGELFLINNDWLIKNSLKNNCLCYLFLFLGQQTSRWDYVGLLRTSMTNDEHKWEQERRMKIEKRWIILQNDTVSVVLLVILFLLYPKEFQTTKKLNEQKKKKKSQSFVDNTVFERKESYNDYVEKRI